MKLIKQQKLFFCEGNSDKVYEVDLCEVDDGMYVVNFRYGRRGANLKEGTKTVLPVDSKKAIEVFDALVVSKTKKGYTDNEQTTPKASEPLKSNSDNLKEQKKKIISHVNDFAAGKTPTGWKLSRILWRVGDLQISKVAPTLTRFLSSSDFNTKYAVCYALAKLKYSECKDELHNFYTRIPDERLKRAALLALLRISDKSQSEALLKKEFPLAYSPINEIYLSKSEENVKDKIRRKIANENISDYSFLWTLYLISAHNYELRKDLQEILATLPLKANYFKYIRYIFKASEFLEDHITYATLAYRFENTTEVFSANYGGTYYNHQHISSVKKELKKPDSRLAFSSKTKAYFNRRILRALNRSGIDSSIEYTNCAT